MEYSVYDQIMLRYLVAWIIVGVLLIGVSCACLIYLFKTKKDSFNDKEDKTTFIICVVLCFIVILGTFVLVGDTIVDATHDLKKHSYIMAEGEFMVVYDEKTPSRACSIILSDGTRLDTTVYVMEQGEYNGCVVYAEKTKKLLHVNVSD